MDFCADYATNVGSGLNPGSQDVGQVFDEAFDQGKVPKDQFRDFVGGNEFPTVHQNGGRILPDGFQQLVRVFSGLDGGTHLEEISLGNRTVGHEGQTGVSAGRLVFLLLGREAFLLRCGKKSDLSAGRAGSKEFQPPPVFSFSPFLNRTHGDAVLPSALCDERGI